ncbi:hypothetical protein ACFSQ7_13510 [Paenibacillus rhizoplanae]
MELNTDHGSYPPRQPLDQSERPPSGEAGEVESLQIRVSLSTEEFSVLEQISKEYSLSSGASVILKNVEAEDGGAQVRKELTVGTSPDIVMLDGHSIYDLATRGLSIACRYLPECSREHPANDAYSADAMERI